MNPAALPILDMLGVPKPQVFELEHAAAAPDDQRFFIRYKPPGRSRVTSGAEIRQMLDAFRVARDAGELLYIEATYESLFGGATLCRREFVYTELVVHHSIALLRRGLCGARILVSPDSCMFWPTFQGWAATQGLTYAWFPCPSPSREVAVGVANDIHRLLPRVEQAVLLEWMYTRAGIVFCDARTDGIDAFGSELLSRGSGKVLEIGGLGQTCADSRWNVVDGFDVDQRPAPQADASLYAINGALLSHYVTRAARRGVRIALAPEHPPLPCSSGGF